MQGFHVHAASCGYGCTVETFLYQSCFGITTDTRRNDKLLFYLSTPISPADLLEGVELSVFVVWHAPIDHLKRNHASWRDLRVLAHAKRGFGAPP